MFYWEVLFLRYEVLRLIMSKVRKVVFRDLVCIYVGIEIFRSFVKIYFIVLVSLLFFKYIVFLDYLLIFYGIIEFVNFVRNSLIFFYFIYEKIRG